MCGNNDHVHDTIPAPPPVRSRVPTRHQIRHAIRKVARTMKGTRDVPMNRDLFIEKAMDAGGWSTLPHDDYAKTLDTLTKSVSASTFFSVVEIDHGCHTSVGLKLRRTAVL